MQYGGREVWLMTLTAVNGALHLLLGEGTSCQDKIVQPENYSSSFIKVGVYL